MDKKYVMLYKHRGLPVCSPLLVFFYMPVRFLQERTDARFLRKRIHKENQTCNLDS